MNLTTFRSNLRRDLKDESPTAQTPTLIDDCDTVWNAAGLYTVVTLDSADKQQGSASMKANIYAGHTTGLFCYHNITTFDLTGYHKLRFWIKSSINQNAGDLQLLLDNTADCGSPVKTLDMPNILAETWYEFEVVLDDTSALADVVSVGLANAVDNGSCLIHLDNLRAIQNSYKWSDDELDDCIARALKDLSYYGPKDVNAGIATNAGSRALDISSFTNRITIYAVEYPVDQYPIRYQRFTSYLDTITLLGEEVPDGSACRVFYGKLHTLDADSSTVPPHLEGLLAQGAMGYALQAYAAYAVERLQADYRHAQAGAARDARQLLDDFHKRLHRMGRFGRVRPGRLYTPATPPVSKTTDWGP